MADYQSFIFLNHHQDINHVRINTITSLEISRRALRQDKSLTHARHVYRRPSAIRTLFLKVKRHPV